MTGLSEVLTPSNPEFQTAVTAAFKPEDRRVAWEISDKGTDGLGWIGGKVFEKKTIMDGCCTFQLKVEKAWRAPVSFSANLSEYFDALPLRVGAEVQIANRGLELEDVDAPPTKLVLKKRFVWREGLVIHVKSKAGEVFLDTFAAHTRKDAPSASPGPSVMGTRGASPSMVPRKRKRTPPPPVHQPPAAPTTAGPSPEQLSAATVQLTENAPAPPPPDSMLLDPPEEQAADELKQANTGSDSQNPQSLPSPPPEVDGITEAQVTGHPRTSPGGDTTDSRQEAVPTTTEEPPQPQEVAPQEPCRSRSPSRPSAGRAEKKTKQRWEVQTAETAELPIGKRGANHARNRKKALRKQKSHATSAAGPEAESRAQSADVDDDEQLWAAAEEDIPDELLNGDAWQQLKAPEIGAVDEPVAVAATEGERQPRHEAPEPRQSSVSRVAKEEKEDPVASLRKSCTTRFGTYIPLIDVQARSRGHIMGVVTAPPEEKSTTTGEYMASFTLLDPTNLASNGLSVTLFNKTERSFPDPEPWRHPAFAQHCLGASFKAWSWAVFHVKTGKVTTAPANTPRHLKADTIELQRCLRLGDWWRDVASSAHSFGIDPAPLISTKRTRDHKLMSEVEPLEYFDCTVEVLHGFQNNNSVHDVYMLFVTDYTRHQCMPPTHGSWCPPKLAEVVLPVELWESAAARGPTMKAGEFYSMRNIKLKWGGSGYLEGKMVEGQKITKLDEDQLEGEPHLVELLKRKKEWEGKANRDGGGHEWPHQLVEEAEKDRHFNCTVEVVHVSPKDDSLYLYVTDYTSRPDLVTVSPSIVTPTASADRIVRISLHDSQVETAKNLEVGDLVSIRKLRLRSTGGESSVHGRLGGDERLITKLNPNSTKNAELRALLRRKAELEAAQSKARPNKKAKEARAARQAKATEATTGRRTTPSEPSVKTKGKGKAVPKAEQYVSLDDVKASDACPSVYRVQARVVDFFPDNLRDCTVLRCTSCNETIPKMRRMCTKCDDAMEDESFARAFYQLCFRIADEDGTTLDVSVSDKRVGRPSASQVWQGANDAAPKQCSVLRDLEPDDVYEDEGAFDMLVARVRPLLGDLLEVSDGEARRRPVSEDDEGSGGPLLDLTIGSWLPEGEPDSADSRAYIVLDHSECDVDA
ncbi:hypothetical protein C8T65DRAFT_734380 [Cerioporus squamosus]|nr:hypothetical protein C8T65DRAFT_734380 [Cerioporus squamosus]